MYLQDVRTVDVELWLHTLTFAPGTRSKIRNIMSAVFNHAIRHEWMDRNPITKVRTSAKRLREPDVLSPAEIASLLAELNLRERAMVMLAGSTGLRRSELVALTWSDIDLELMQVNVRRSCVRNHFGDTKTEASRKPVPLHPSVVKCLKVWREDSPYRGDDDFIFPSIRRKGKQPLSPDTLLKKIIRPAVVRAGIEGKAIGWHSFRHYAVFRTMPNVICAMVAHASESAGSPFSGSAVFGIVRHASQALEEAKQLIVRSVRSSPSFDGGSLRKHLLFQGEVGVEVDLGCFD
jgi:integrase